MSSSFSPRRVMSWQICSWTFRMASSTPGSVPPSLSREPIVSSLQGAKRPMPRIPSSPGPYARAWRRLQHDRTGMAMLVFVVAVALVVILVPAVITIDPYKQDLRASLLPPGSQGHLLGTDHFGRDLVLRMIDGGRASLSLGLIAVTIAVTVGGLVGLVAGYRGGAADRVLMRLIDVELAFPGILLALVIVTILGSGSEKLTVAVGIGGIPRFARIVRGTVLATKHELYIEAADAGLLLVARVLRNFSYGYLVVVVGIYLDQLGLTPIEVGAVLTASAAGSAALTIGWSLLADRIGRRRSIRVLSLLMVAGGLTFVITSDPWLLALAAFAGSLSVAGTDTGTFVTVDQSMLPQVSADHRRTSTFALQNMFATLAVAVGSLAAGAVPLLARIGLQGPDAYRPLFVLFAIVGLADRKSTRLNSSHVKISYA